MHRKDQRLARLQSAHTTPTSARPNDTTQYNQPIRHVCDGIQLLLAHAASEYNQGQQVSQLLKVLCALCQYHRRPPFADGLRYVLTDEFISCLICNQFVVQIVELAANIRTGCLQRVEPRGADKNRVCEGPSTGLFLCVDTMANRPALHKDNWMMPVFAGHGCREARNILCLRSPGHMLETLGREGDGTHPRSEGHIRRHGHQPRLCAPCFE